jgi:hypothetical protein
VVAHQVLAGVDCGPARRARTRPRGRTAAARARRAARCCGSR